MAIGQGANEFTPLELANYVATLANGGKRMRPYLVQQIEDREGKVVARFGPSVVHTADVSRQTMETVREAMAGVTAPGGTASWLFHDLPVKVAAKTGTAQSGRKRGGVELYHGVFIAFAPVEKPEIAFAGIIEYGYHGSESSGPVAKDVFMEYFGFNKDKKQGAAERDAGQEAAGSEDAGGQAAAAQRPAAQSRPQQSSPPVSQPAPGGPTPAPPPQNQVPAGDEPGAGQPPGEEQPPPGPVQPPGGEQTTP
jgi:penicillin-binding protein 2